MRLRLVAGCVVLVGVTAVCAAPAGASTQVGETFVPGFFPPQPLVYQSVSAPDHPSYAVPAAGVLTSWSHIAVNNPTTTLKFMVLRPTGTEFQAVGVTDP